MGEHQTWFEFFGGGQLSHQAQPMLGRTWTFSPLEQNHFVLTHVVFAVVALLIMLLLGMAFLASVGRKNGLVPAERFGARAFLEMLCDATYGLMIGVMGEKNARRYFWLIGSLALFILFSNLMALVPGMGVPTTSLNTNLALALFVFVLTHLYGLREHGLAYFKHFLGPLWWLTPLILPIEIISHISRPVSLSIRLLGNMSADHKVVFTFFTLVPVLVPVPFLILGTLVSVVQTLVFCLLSMVYISLATAHDH